MPVISDAKLGLGGTQPSGTPADGTRHQANSDISHAGAVRLNSGSPPYPTRASE